MKLRTLRLALPLLLATLGVAQAAPPLPAAAAPPKLPPPLTIAARRPQITSPEVAADGTVTLRLYAPRSKRVEVVGEFAARPLTMTRAGHGVWSLTLGPLAPNIYTYQYEVDGVPVADPLNPSVADGFGFSPPGSSFEVPTPGGAYYDARQVPHGTVRIETYHSAAIGAARKLWVYTPPGYDSGQQRYPVLYLMHGAGGRASDWVRLGRENYVLDNLIAGGKARPMIVVNPFVYPWPGIDTGPARAADQVGESRVGWSAGKFESDLLGSVLPYVESHFRTLNTADGRALGGLSMGGMRTITIGFEHPDVFHSLVILSAGTKQAAAVYPAFFADPARINATLQLLWIGVGGEDPLMIDSARALDASLTRAGIHHDFWVLPDRRHEWIVWRDALHTFAPLLFQPNKP